LLPRSSHVAQLAILKIDEQDGDGSMSQPGSWPPSDDSVLLGKIDRDSDTKTLATYSCTP